MNTDNITLMRMARESLKGKWEIAILTFLILILISGSGGAVHILGSIATLIVGGPLTLGAAIFSLNLSRNKEIKIEQIFQGFNRFEVSLVAYLLMILYIILWTLLFIIPGIIAALSYSMTFYILADDPLCKAEEALQKSKQMMEGYKWKLFYLYLRFLLLAFLCVLTLGIGFLWLIPYINITMAKFYEDIRETIK